MLLQFAEMCRLERQPGAGEEVAVDATITLDRALSMLTLEVEGQQGFARQVSSVQKMVDDLYRAQRSRSRSGTHGSEGCQSFEPGHVPGQAVSSGS